LLAMVRALHFALLSFSIFQSGDIDCCIIPPLKNSSNVLYYGTLKRFE